MVLELERVGKKRGEGYELFIDRFQVEKQERVAIIGPSGCGKSTTLDILGMVLDPTHMGKFVLSPGEGSHDIAALWEKDRQYDLTELRRKHFGYVLQTGEIFSFLNVRGNIELTALASGLGKEGAAERAKDLMERLELTRLAKAMPATLSIGQRQRVAIARALAPRPCLLLADEPTSALDPGLARRVMSLLIETVADYGSSLIMVSHDIALVRKFDFREAAIKMKSIENGVRAILDDR